MNHERAEIELGTDVGVADYRRTFPADPSSVPAARRMVLACLEHSDDEDLALLLTSELAANAVQHAGTPFAVAVNHTSSGELLVEVRDGCSDRPVVGVVLPTSTRGRGLRLIEQFARVWGITTHEHHGKTVWFRLAPLT